MERLTKVDIVENIIEDVDEELMDEEMIHLLLEKSLSQEMNRQAEKNTFGQRAADNVAQFVGSWKFIIIFSVIFLLWVSSNLVMATRAFDPYPFILLNLALSCIAAIQAPLIMMSQNRQEQKDRRRQENDYKVNLKTEIIIQDLHIKLDRMLTTQTLILEELSKKSEEGAASGV
jgi:uncharacterized membrane protein